MANLNFDFHINITNGAQLKAKCARLSEIFAEAGEILGNVGSGTSIACDGVNEVPEQDKPVPSAETAFVRGARFEYGTLEWIALEEVNGGVLAVAAECIKDEDGDLDEMPFDKGNKNDWRKSSIRAFLNGEFLEYIGADNLIKQTLDLTADDGMKDYGTSKDYVSVLSCEQYRKYRDILPDYGCWWWTLTPWTCITSSSSYVRFVHPSGSVAAAATRTVPSVSPPLVFSNLTSIMRADRRRRVNVCAERPVSCRLHEGNARISRQTFRACRCRPSVWYQRGGRHGQVRAAEI